MFSLEKEVSDRYDAGQMSLHNILTDKSIGHSEAARRISNIIDYIVSETSVRRYRKKHNIELITPTPESVSSEVTDTDNTEFLRKEVLRLGRENDKIKASKDEYVKAIYNAVQDAWNSWGGYDPLVYWNQPESGPGTEEVAVALLSDLQLAKVTRKGEDIQYNSQIAEQRVMEYADKIIEITNIQRSHHPVNKVVVPVLGDIIEGEEIFPGQMWLIDGGLYRQITVDGPRIIVNFVRKLLTSFKSVEIVWVIGNHGRIGGVTAKNHDPETNGDRMLGQICKMLLDNEPRVTFRVKDGPGESNWFDIVTIGNYSALAIHGNQIPGQSGLPFTGIAKKVNGWAAGAIEEDFQDVYMGHYHTRAVIPVNKRNVYVNGSTESYSTYAQEVMAAMSDPSQWLLYVHPVHGRVTASYGVELT